MTPGLQGGSGGPAPRSGGPEVVPRARPRSEALLAALQTVRDPELDEPITALGFVAGCDITAGGDALVRLRLPTYFCAPNF
ncbi:MAG: iron-sulfur cluster assembly protein, partial [Streptosporangiaceae bacterium]